MGASGTLYLRAAAALIPSPVGRVGSGDTPLLSSTAAGGHAHARRHASTGGLVWRRNPSYGSERWQNGVPLTAAVAVQDHPHEQGAAQPLAHDGAAVRAQEVMRPAPPGRVALSGALGSTRSRDDDALVERHASDGLAHVVP